MLRRADVRNPLEKLAVGTLAVLCAIAAYGIGSGRYLITGLVAGIVVIPVAIIVALRRPYLFPFGLYVALVPFDNLLLLGSSGTLTKILGMASGAVIAASLLRRRSLVRPSRSLWLWFAFILWLGTTLLWTQDVPQGQRAALQMASIVLLFAILALAPLDERELRTVCACIMFGGAAAALYGMYLFHNASFHNDPNGTGRLMIDVGGLTKFAAGNNAKIIRHLPEGNDQTIPVRLGELMNGAIKYNVVMRPGDVLIIPQSLF